MLVLVLPVHVWLWSLVASKCGRIQVMVEGEQDFQSGDAGTSKTYPTR